MVTKKKLVPVIFEPPCISNKTQHYTIYLYLETALNVSGGISIHNQEHTPVSTASGTCQIVTATCRNRGGVEWSLYAHSSIRGMKWSLYAHSSIRGMKWSRYAHSSIRGMKWSRYAHSSIRGMKCSRYAHCSIRGRKWSRYAHSSIPAVVCKD